MRHYVAALLLLILDFILILGIAAMKTTPRDCSLLDEFDYIFTSPTRSRKKAGPAIWHAPMILPLASDSSSNSDANREPNLPPSDSNDDITAMLLDTLESPPGPHRQSPPHSSSPAPVWCEGCDVQAPDGDDDPQEVECEVCKFWSHIACLTREQEDWNDPKVSFVCKRCQVERALDFFTEHQIIMMPLPARRRLIFTEKQVPTPELEAVLMEPLGNLLKHELLADVLQPERHRRVMAVGSALFQLLALQHILGEELSLDGSILNDLALGDVVPRSSDGPEALVAMFAVIPSSAALSGKWAAHMQQFNGAHSFYDPDFCPPIFRHLNGPQVEKKTSSTGSGQQACKADEKSDLTNDPEKDLSSSIPQRKNPRRKPAGSTTKPVQVTKFKKKSRYPGYIDIDSDGNEL
ncbi:hypothetical protein B0H14DRAFT_2613335 [Mycena olivaceomarginata]|nr:hypothetical protein B0H14DRAFT_2613335 [Mycena olivaceomarginata]